MGSRATERNSPIMIDNDPDNVPEGNQRRIEFFACDIQASQNKHKRPASPQKTLL